MLHVRIVTDRSRVRGRGIGKGDGEAYELGVIYMHRTLSGKPSVPDLVWVRYLSNGIGPHPLR